MSFDLLLKHWGGRNPYSKNQRVKKCASGCIHGFCWRKCVRVYVTVSTHECGSCNWNKGHHKRGWVMCGISPVDSLSSQYLLSLKKLTHI